MESGEGSQTLAQSVVGLLCAPDGVGGLQGMEVGKSRHGGYFLIDFGIILHGAAAKRIEAVVNTEVVAAVVGVVPYYRKLINLGQLGVLLSEQLLWQLAMSKLVLWQRVCLPTFL